MGYLTVTVVVDVSAEELKAQFNRYSTLHKQRPEGAEEFDVEIAAGRHCSAIWANSYSCPNMYLYPIGPQLAARWLHVRYQDDISWDLSCYTAFEHEVSHHVNPWHFEPDFEYNAEDARRIEYRIDKLCRLLPQYAEVIRPYLQLWRYPTDPADPRTLVDRKGKARATDDHEYGDAYQYHDFLECFGIDIGKPLHTVKVRI